MWLLSNGVRRLRWTAPEPLRFVPGFVRWCPTRIPPPARPRPLEAPDPRFRSLFPRIPRFLFSRIWNVASDFHELNRFVRNIIDQPTTTPRFTIHCILFLILGNCTFFRPGLFFLYCVMMGLGGCLALPTVVSSTASEHYISMCFVSVFFIPSTLPSSVLCFLVNLQMRKCIQGSTGFPSSTPPRSCPPRLPPLPSAHTPPCPPPRPAPPPPVPPRSHQMCGRCAVAAARWPPHGASPNTFVDGVVKVGGAMAERLFVMGDGDHVRVAPATIGALATEAHFNLQLKDRPGRSARGPS